jgi:hypothetical protein
MPAPVCLTDLPPDGQVRDGQWTGPLWPGVVAWWDEEAHTHRRAGDTATAPVAEIADAWAPFHAFIIRERTRLGRLVPSVREWLEEAERDLAALEAGRLPDG